MKRNKTKLKKNILAIVVSIVCSTSAFAQTVATETPASSFWIKFPDYLTNPMLWFVVIMTFILLMVFYAFSRSAIALSHSFVAKNKKTLMVSLLTLAGAYSFAQASSAPQPITDPNSFWMKFPDYISNPMVWFLIMMAIVLFIVFYALSRSVMVLSRQVSGIADVKGTAPAVARVRTQSSWSKLMKLLTRSVPVQQEADVMLDHNYDGIRELDNQLPPWWKWGFYFTIAFAVFYLYYYHVSGQRKLQLSEYADEMKQAQLASAERMKNAANNVTAANVVAFTDASEIAEGKNIFTKNCIACHGNAGQGNVVPNLTDDYWLHGGGIKNVFHTITEGVPAKGMISWKTQLAPKQIQEVASFVLTLHGTNPPAAKEPQGDIWIEKAKTDSVGATASSSSVQ